MEMALKPQMQMQAIKRSSLDFMGVLVRDIFYNNPPQVVKFRSARRVAIIAIAIVAIRAFGWITTQNRILSSIPFPERSKRPARVLKPIARSATRMWCISRLFIRSTLQNHSVR